MPMAPVTQPTPSDDVCVVAGTDLSTQLGGCVKLLQPVKGYRAGLDAALLAAAAATLVHSNSSKSALELGCGVGAALYSLKARCPDLTLTGLERDPLSCDLARRNARLNGSEAGGSDVAIIEGDVAAGFRNLGIERVDLVLSNPPYFDDPTTLRAPTGTKRGAWIADDGLKVWLDMAVAAVRDGGDIVLIHRADRLADILGGLAPKAGSFVILPVQPYADQPAKRVIVAARRLGKSPLKLLPALVLHDQSERKHRAEVEALLRGETDLTLG